MYIVYANNNKNNIASTVAAAAMWYYHHHHPLTIPFEYINCEKNNDSYISKLCLSLLIPIVFDCLLYNAMIYWASNARSRVDAHFFFGVVIDVHIVESNQPQRDWTHKQNAKVIRVRERERQRKNARFEYNKI